MKKKNNILDRIILEEVEKLLSEIQLKEQSGGTGQKVSLKDMNQAKMREESLCQDWGLEDWAHIGKCAPYWFMQGIKWLLPVLGVVGLFKMAKWKGSVGRFNSWRRSALQGLDEANAMEVIGGRSLEQIQALRRFMGTDPPSDAEVRLGEKLGYLGRSVEDAASPAAGSATPPAGTTISVSSTGGVIAKAFGRGLAATWRFTLDRMEDIFLLRPTVRVMQTAAHLKGGEFNTLRNTARAIQATALELKELLKPGAAKWNSLTSGHATWLGKVEGLTRQLHMLVRSYGEQFINMHPPTSAQAQEMRNLLREIGEPGRIVNADGDVVDDGLGLLNAMAQEGIVHVDSVVTEAPEAVRRAAASVGVDELTEVAMNTERFRVLLTRIAPGVGDGGAAVPNMALIDSVLRPLKNLGLFQKEHEYARDLYILGKWLKGDPVMPGYPIPAGFDTIKTNWNRMISNIPDDTVLMDNLTTGALMDLPARPGTAAAHETYRAFRTEAHLPSREQRILYNTLFACDDPTIRSVVTARTEPPLSDVDAARKQRIVGEIRQKITEMNGRRAQTEPAGGSVPVDSPPGTQRPDNFFSLLHDGNNTSIAKDVWKFLFPAAGVYAGYRIYDAADTATQEAIAPDDEIIQTHVYLEGGKCGDLIPHASKTAGLNHAQWETYKKQWIRAFVFLNLHHWAYVKKTGVETPKCTSGASGEKCDIAIDLYHTDMADPGDLEDIIKKVDGGVKGRIDEKEVLIPVPIVQGGNWVGFEAHSCMAADASSAADANFGFFADMDGRRLSDLKCHALNFNAAPAHVFKQYHKQGAFAEPLKGKTTKNGEYSGYKVNTDTIQQLQAMAGQIIGAW